MSFPSPPTLKYNRATNHYSDYKFTKLLHHEADFVIQEESHYLATAHEKGPCDGIELNLKRFAARASLQALSQNQNLTTDALYQWAKRNLPGTVIFFISMKNHVTTAENLKT